MSAAEESRPDQGPPIEVRGLVSRFGDHVVHDGLDLTVNSGEVLGVVGGSGSGKSVLLRTIIGLKKPDGGQVRLFGHDTADISYSQWSGIERRWGVLFQHGALFTALTVKENVMAPMREHTDLSDAEQDEIELRPLPDEMMPQRTFVVSRSHVCTGTLGRHWMDIGVWTRHMVQQRLFGHPVIAARILRRNVPLVSPEDLHIHPWDPGSKLGCEQAIERARRTPPSQHDRTRAGGSHRAGDRVHSRFGRSPAQVSEVRTHAHVRRLGSSTARAIALRTVFDR